MSESQEILSTAQVVAHMVLHAHDAGLPMSEAQAVAISEHLDSLTHREGERAVSLVQAFSTKGCLDYLPQSLWTPQGERGGGVAGIVLSYIIGGLTQSQRDVLWLCVFLKNRSSYACFDSWFELESEHVQAHVLTLQRHGLLGESDEGISSPIPPLVALVRHRVWTLEHERALIRCHAQHVVDCIAYERVWYVCYSGATDVPVMRYLKSHIEELYELAIRVQEIDAELCAKLVCSVLLFELQQGPTERSAALVDVSTTLHHVLGDDELASHLLIMLASLEFRGSGQLPQVLSWVDEAERRVAQIGDFARRDIASLCIMLKRAFFLERLNIDVPQTLEVLEAWHARAPTLPHIPVVLNVTLLRYMSRLSHLTEQEQSADDFARQALALAVETRDPGLICVTKLEYAESCSRLEKNEEFETLCWELLTVSDQAYFPRMFAFLRLSLGYFYFGADRARQSYELFEEAIPFFERGGEDHIHHFLMMMIVAMDIEDGRVELALVRLKGLNGMLDVMAEPELVSATQLVFVLCAVLYALCDELHMATRVLGDARVYSSRCTETEYMSWGLDYAQAHVDLITAVLNPPQQASLTQHAELLEEIGAQRQSADRKLLLREGLLYMKQGFDRIIDVWLASHGVSVARPVRLHIDAWEPTWFAVNHLPRVSIKRRQAMRRILTALLHASRFSGAKPLSLEEMFEVGWPGEVASYESMQARVYNAVSRMRKLGLDELILHDGQGYRWDEHCDVVVE